MIHSRTKLTAYGRQLLCERIQSGWSLRGAARAAGISPARAHALWHLYLRHREAAFAIRSSRPHRSPRRTPRRIEERIERERRSRRVGPRAIAWALGLARSTVYAVLRRLGLAHLKVFRERRRFRRYERAAPGDLGHIDTKKLPRLGAGLGHRFAERASAVRHRGLGSVYEHVLVDDRSRVSYRETLPSEGADDAVDFLGRALRHFASLGVRFRQLMSDNHFSYTKSRRFAELLAANGIAHITIPPYTPRWNGKVEAFIKILLREAAYDRPYASEAQRERAFRRFDHRYNFVRRHGELGGLTPMQRLAQDLLDVNKVHGQNT